MCLRLRRQRAGGLEVRITKADYQGWLLGWAQESVGEGKVVIMSAWAEWPGRANKARVVLQTQLSARRL